MSFEAVMIVALLPMPLLDAAATVFFFRLFMRSEHEAVPGSDAPHWRSRFLGSRSWLLGLLTLAFAIITAAFVIIGLLALARIFDFRIAGGLALLAVSLFFLGTIPPAFMWAFWQMRKPPSS